MNCNDANVEKRYKRRLNEAYADMFKAAGDHEVCMRDFAHKSLDIERALLSAAHVRKAITLPDSDFQFSDKIKVHEVILAVGSLAYFGDIKKLVWLVEDCDYTRHLRFCSATSEVKDKEHSLVHGDKEYNGIRVFMLYDVSSLSVGCDNSVSGPRRMDLNVVAFLTVDIGGREAQGIMVMPTGFSATSEGLPLDATPEACVRGGALPSLYIIDKDDMLPMPPLHSMGAAAMSTLSHLGSIKEHVKSHTDPKILNTFGDADTYRHIMCAAVDDEGFAKPLAQLKHGTHRCAGTLVFPAIMTAFPTLKKLTVPEFIIPVQSTYTSGFADTSYANSSAVRYLKCSKITVPLIDMSETELTEYGMDLVAYDFKCAFNRLLNIVHTGLSVRAHMQESAPVVAPEEPHVFRKGLDLPEATWQKSEFQYTNRHKHMHFDSGSDITCMFCRKNPVYPHVVCEKCHRTFCVEHVMERKDRVFCARCMREEIKQEMTRQALAQAQASESVSELVDTPNPENTTHRLEVIEGTGLNGNGRVHDDSVSSTTLDADGSIPNFQVLNSVNSNSPNNEIDRSALMAAANNALPGRRIPPSSEEISAALLQGSALIDTVAAAMGVPPEFVAPPNLASDGWADGREDTPSQSPARAGNEHTGGSDV